MVLGGMVLGMAGLLGSIGIMHMHARAGWSPWWLTLTLLVLGVGQGLVVSPNQTLSLADVPLEYAGAAGGILQTGERIGTSIGIAVITGLTFRVSHSSGWEAAAQAGLLAVVAGISEAALDEMLALAEASEGGMLGLFSSRRAAQEAAEVLRGATDLPVYAQGDDQLPTLVRAFAEDEAACLVGTLSLWQGVDVPGRTCRLVAYVSEQIGVSLQRLLDSPRKFRGAGHVVFEADRRLFYVGRVNFKQRVRILRRCKPQFYQHPISFKFSRLDIISVLNLSKFATAFRLLIRVKISSHAQNG